MESHQTVLVAWDQWHAQVAGEARAPASGRQRRRATAL